MWFTRRSMTIKAPVRPMPAEQWTIGGPRPPISLTDWSTASKKLKGNPIKRFGYHFCRDIKSMINRTDCFMIPFLLKMQCLNSKAAMVKWRKALYLSRKVTGLISVARKLRSFFRYTVKLLTCVWETKPRHLQPLPTSILFYLFLRKHCSCAFTQKTSCQ